MRLLHTSDWHLGHLLHELPRDREHAAFLAWLLDVVEAERVDALLVAGDVFDSGNPPAGAQAAWFGFLAEAHRRRPQLTIVAIAGNHDSPSRMVAPAPLYAGVRAHVVGALPRVGGPGGAVDVDRLLVPLAGPEGDIEAWAVAVPFLRPFDLDGEPADATREVYRAALAAARARRRRGQAIVAMGHLHLQRGEASPGSERRLPAGGLESIASGDLFADVAYVALGHLHKAQRVGGEHVRYAGSPIPLAMGEADYRHQVALVEIEGGGVSEIRTLAVPRTVDLLRVPRRGAAPLADVLAELRGLPEAIDGEDPDLRPFLEVRVRLAGPTPHLRAQIGEATRGKRPRLVKITTEAAGDGRALAEALPSEVLAELDPREVLRRKWGKQHDGPLPPAVMGAFERLLAEVEAAS